MPKALSGKLALFMLAIFVGQLLALLIVGSIEGLLTIVTFSHLTRYTAIIGLIVGVAGVLQENGKGRIIPILTLVLSVALAAFNGYLMFIWG
ncbi:MULTISPECIES: hypothetical protein [Pontibacillus]|uniref:DUF4064 domain-containing protein n=1 Tax=Pontibacillus chungwhensis TaxID=265426 RepID=A0ABY8V495_9BACI|nr:MULTISPECIES: hypothetical protein [Pontibacillus]MCD5322115.1 hypothetical protein [Pontibacillus sp. HN14]WIF99414.1 hypothetical protein QNI29_07075 [Pontibacillus chungwhensis]